MKKQIKQAAALAVLAAMTCVWVSACGGYSSGTSTAQPSSSAPMQMKADSTAADTSRH